MLAMTSVVVENVFYLLSNFPYFTVGAPKCCRAWGNSPYSPSRRLGCINKAL